MQLKDPCIRGQPTEARNYFLACYAVSLIQGHTIKGSCIKHATVLKYLAQAYTLFEKRHLVFHSEPDFVGIILKAQKDYEDIPNRRK